MSFNEWFEKQEKLDNGIQSLTEYDGKLSAGSGWNACKKEVLKILKSHIKISRGIADDSEGFFEYKHFIIENPEMLLEEVKKL